MIGKRLGDELVNLEIVSGGFVNPDVKKIHERDRSRMRWLTIATIGLWVLAAVAALVIFVIAGFAIPAISELLKQSGQAGLDQPDTPLHMLAKLTAMNIVTTVFSFAALVGAGLSTLLLIYLSRRITLRQINSNLQQISEQLKSRALNDRTIE